MDALASVSSQCPVCKAACSLQIRQYIEQASLRWAEQFECTCGHGFQTGGVGLPTPGLRNALLAQCGSAELWVDEASSFPQVELLLVKGLSMDPLEVSRRLASAPAAVFHGTGPEAEFVRLALLRGRVVARVVLASSAP